MKKYLKILIFTLFMFSIQKVCSFPSINVIPYCYKDGKALFLLCGEVVKKCTKKGILFGSFYAEIQEGLSKEEAIDVGAEFIWTHMSRLNIVYNSQYLKDSLKNSVEIVESKSCFDDLYFYTFVNKISGSIYHCCSDSLQSKHMFFLQCDYKEISRRLNGRFRLVDGVDLKGKMYHKISTDVDFLNIFFIKDLKSAERELDFIIGQAKIEERRLMLQVSVKRWMTPFE